MNSIELNVFAGNRRLAVLVALALVLVMSHSRVPAEQERRVPRWEPHDFAFRGEARAANPFLVEFSAMVRGPDGTEMVVPGFYDGDGTWKVRVSPTVEGRWSIVTRSDQPSLDGQRAAFICSGRAEGEVRGALRVDSENPRHFVWEDGSRFFLMGYECDWLWALDMTSPETPVLDAFLDKLVDHGFNYIILNAYAHDTGWRSGTTGPDDYGPPPLYAWGGTNEEPDHSRLDLDYWQHYDRVIEAMHRRGIVAHIMIKVYNKRVRWPTLRSVQDDLYFRWLIARYAAYPNVIWDYSKEAHLQKDLDYKRFRLGFLQQHDPYQRLRTIHDDTANYDAGHYDDLLDYRSDQQHARWRQTILSQRAQRTWPVVNVEFGYEHGPEGLEDKTYGVVQSPEEVCRRAWEIYLAGGYGAYYYTYTAWDVIRPEDTPPGYAYFRNLRDFFERTRYWRMEPTEGLVSNGYCLADRGREYVVFLNRAEPFTLELEPQRQPLAAEWFQPLTGQRRPAGPLREGILRLQPPVEWGTGPVALHAQAAQH
jgi:hypothetical protein